MSSDDRSSGSFPFFLVLTAYPDDPQAEYSSGVASIGSLLRLEEYCRECGGARTGNGR